MIAPSDHFELVPAEIVKHEIAETDLISTRYWGKLAWRHQETDLFSLGFVDDQRRIVPSVVDQPGAGKPVDRIAIAGGWQLEVKRNFTREPCGNGGWRIRLNFGGKAAFEIAAMGRYRSLHIARSPHPPHRARSKKKTQEAYHERGHP